VAKDVAQFSNNEDTLLSVGPFVGLDTTTDPYFVSPNNCVAQQNVAINRVYGSYCTYQGRAANYTGALFPNTLLGIGTTSILRNNALVNYTNAVYALCYNSGTGLVTTYYAGYLQAPVVAFNWTPTAAESTGTTAIYESNIVFAGIYVFPDCPLAQPQFMAPTTGLGPFLGVTTYFWGIAAPTTAVTTTLDNLIGGLTQNSTYYYAVTFLNTSLSPNSESGSNPFSAPAVTGAAPLNSFNLTNVPISPDPQVTARNIYRFGGTIGGTALLVGVIPNNTATTFLDTLADFQITGQQLIIRQDPAPPSGWQSIAYHKGRMWGLGSLEASNVGKSDLWYSNYLQFTSFNSVTQVLDCGSDLNDKPLALASLDSVLVVLKQLSIWICYGDTQNDFVTRRAHSVSCVSKGSVAVGFGRVFWLGVDGVYMYDGSSAPTNISDGTIPQGSIRNTIDVLLQQPNDNILAPNVGCRGFIHERTYYLSVYSLLGTTAEVTYGYDILIGVWTVLPYGTSAVAVCDNSYYNYSLPVMGVPIVLGANAGTPGQVDQWFATETDLGNPIQSSWLTNISDSGATALTKQYRFIEVIAPSQTGILNVQLIVNPGANATILPTFASAYTIDLSVGTSRHRISLPMNAVGYECQLKLSMSTSQKTSINKVSVLGYIKRQSSPPPLNS
jgi:hypothetical protein